MNSLGTYNIAGLASEFGVETMVVISTDKAVKPSSVMGVSKRIAEEFVRSISSRSKTKFGIVRFGNVLGSRGSVIPLFKKQIQSGGPVTVTDPRMTRYFMTIPEAVSLCFRQELTPRWRCFRARYGRTRQDLFSCKRDDHTGRIRAAAK